MASERDENERDKFSYEEIFEYLAHGQYPAAVDKNYKHGLRKRSKFFIQEEGRLFYIGGKKQAAAARRRLAGGDGQTGEGENHQQRT